MAIVNTTGVKFERPVRLPDGWAGHDVADETGAAVEVQREGAAAWVAPAVAARGVRTLHRGAKAAAARGGDAAPARAANGWVLENELVRYTFDAAGTLTEGYDKQEKRKVLTQPAALQLFEDAPVNWEAWDVDIFYTNQLRETLKPASCETLWRTAAPGPESPLPLRQVDAQAAGRAGAGLQAPGLCHRGRLARAAADAAGRLLHRPRQRQRPLRHPVRDPREAGAPATRAGTGRASRSAGHRFADLSFGGWGVAVLNDCKYGYKVLNGEISLNLLRSPVHPDPEADQGSHLFTYSLLPHAGDLRDSSVFAEATSLNQPPLVFGGLASKEAALMLPAHIDGEGVVFEVMKKAERGEAWVLRAWECRGCRVEATLTVAGKARCHETDLMERDLQEVKLEGGAARIALRPFDVRTFKVTAVK